MADESSNAKESSPAPSAAPTNTWKLPDGIEDHIEAGT
jgi:hypothetical protein